MAEKSVDQAVTDALKQGEKAHVTKAAGGEELVQRPISITRSAPEPMKKVSGKRVKVYHKRRTTMHLTDCKLGPEEEGEILVSDYELPQVQAHVVKLA